MSRGRSYCSAVESYECEAPAGYMNARGFSSVSGVKKSELLTCAYCEELVCSKCCDWMTPPEFLAGEQIVPVGLDHSPEELAMWLGVA